VNTEGARAVAGRGGQARLNPLFGLRTHAALRRLLDRIEASGDLRVVVFESAVPGRLGEVRKFRSGLAEGEAVGLGA
jgi:hypothetical protein